MSSRSSCTPRRWGRAALAEAKRKLERDRIADDSEDDESGDGGDAQGERRSTVELRFDREVVQRASGRGRRRWFVEARQQLDEQRRVEAWTVPRSRAERLLEVERRLCEQLGVEREANRAYERYVAGGVTPAGRRFSARPTPYVVPEEPTGKINLTDPDSRTMQTRQGWVQGYNAQAAVNENLRASRSDGRRRRARARPGRCHRAAGGVVADAGYWHQPQMEKIVSRGSKWSSRPTRKVVTVTGRDGTAGSTRSCAA